MNTKYNESDWGWFVDLDHNDVTIYKPLVRSSLPTIHEYEYEYEYPEPKYIVDGYYDLENNDTKGYTETKAYTIYKPSMPTIYEYQLQLFINGNVVQEITIPWIKVEQVVLNLKIPWSGAGNFGALFMVFILYSLYKYHAL